MKATVKRWYTRLNQPIAATSPFWRTALWTVIGLYVILALAQSFWVPVFEGPDEQRHYAYARYLINNRAMPPRPTEVQKEYYTYQVAQEAGQPPLYYLLVGLITAPVSGADKVDALVHHNWFVSASDDQGIPYDNHRWYLYSNQDDFPWQAASLAVRLGRLLSVCMGALTLWGIYGIARSVMPELPLLALLATTFFALLPKFIFVTATINNDVPVTLFATLSMWVAMCIVRKGPTAQLAILGAVLSALTALSKFNGMWVIGALGIAIIGSAWMRRRENNRSNVWLALGLLVGIWLLLAGWWLLLAGWWFVYSYLQDGDPLGVAVHTSKSGQGILSVIQVDWSMLNMVSLGLWERSTWYSVAWSQINGQDGFYMLFRVMYMVGLLGAVLAGIGVVKRIVHERRENSTLLLHVVLLVFALVCIVVLAVLWQSTGRNKLGRYLYPGLTSVVTLLVMGWVWWFRRLRKSRFRYVIYWIGVLLFTGVMVSSAVWSTFHTLRNLLPHPVIRPLPADVIHTQLLFLDPAYNRTPVAEVTGYRVSSADLRLGNALYAELCWRSTGYTTQNFPYTLQIVGPDDARYGSRNSYHGLGSYPLTNWPVGDEFCDSTSVYIAFAADRPRAYQLYVSLFQADLVELKAGPPLRVLDGDGREAYPVIGRVRVAPSSMPIVTHTVNVGNLAGLVDSHIELDPRNVLSVTLRWVALKPDGRNAKVFLHVVDRSGKLIAQHDHDPDAGWFPTAYWQADDVIDDEFSVSLPAGVALNDVDLRIGLYDAQTLERLPAVDVVSGARLQDDMVPLDKP